MTAAPKISRQARLRGMRGTICGMLAGAALLFGAAGAQAAPVGYEDPQVLKIEPGAGEPVQTYTPEQLQSTFAMQEVETLTPWSKGIRIRYRGPALKDLLARGKMSDVQSVDVFAFDDFLTTIPMSDISQYDPILATERGCTAEDYQTKRCQDGQAFTALRIGDYGPYYMVWPSDKLPASFIPERNAVWVWYVVALRPGT